jgi:hypothetical protein
MIRFTDSFLAGACFARPGRTRRSIARRPVHQIPLSMVGPIKSWYLSNRASFSPTLCSLVWESVHPLSVVLCMPSKKYQTLRLMRSKVGAFRAGFSQSNPMFAEIYIYSATHAYMRADYPFSRLSSTVSII